MKALAFAGGDFARLRAELLASAPAEAAAILFATRARDNGSGRLLVRDFEVVTPENCLRQDETGVTVSPTAVADAMKRARAEKLSLIFVHTHPFDDYPKFSTVDVAGEAELIPALMRRVPNVAHGSLIIGRRGFEAKIWEGGGAPHFLQRVEEIGAQIIYHASARQFAAQKALPLGFGGEEPSDVSSSAVDQPEFDRNRRAFGSAGQKILGDVCVGIVGLGGTGSVVAEQLAHLGVRNFVLLDPDVIERSNTNRVIGSVGRVGQPKVDSAASYIRHIRPDAQIESVRGAVHVAAQSKPLLHADLIFGCTDSHGSRAVLNQIAYQYLIPTFDVGIRIDAAEGQVKAINGRAQMLAPGLPCLVCQQLLDPEEVRRDLLSEEERLRDSYIVGDREPQPSVISLNSTVASLAVTMALGALTGLPLPARHQLYLADRGVVRQAAGAPATDCIVCSRRGALARGDTWPLPWRLA